MRRKKQQVKRWGNGLGIFLSKSLAEAVGFKVDTEITPEVKTHGELVFTSEKAPAVSVTDFNDLVLLEVEGVVIPLQRQTAIEIANKTGSHDGFADAGDITELSVTPDAGCIKLKLDHKTAAALKKQLNDLKS